MFDLLIEAVPDRTANARHKIGRPDRSASTDNFVSTPAMKTLPSCPVSFTSRITGGKWKARLVWALLRNGSLRFSELRRACPPITDRILSKELRELENWGLVAKAAQPLPRLRTDYSLTPLGLTLGPLLETMADWGERTQEITASATEPR